MNLRTTAGLAVLVETLSSCTVFNRYAFYQHSISYVSPDIKISGLGTYSVIADNIGCHASLFMEIPRFDAEFSSTPSFSRYGPLEQAQIEKDLLRQYCPQNK
ncbi:hypothetical protein HZA99_03235 [Candidatus Woesearchaeota archaeon]|nr:hypothetical protein [Candidatus Woesearchaeota archaeon]